MTSPARACLASLFCLSTACAEGLAPADPVEPPAEQPAATTCTTPGAATCADGRATLCNDRGEIVEWECDPVQGMVCEPAGCTGICSPLTIGPSTMGCDYHPTVTPNPVWSGFEFAVVVGNTKDGPVNVTVTRGDELVATRTIPADSLEAITLPWVAELKGPDFNAGGQIDSPSGETAIVRGGAYRLRTDRPVTVYQFSALDYTKPSKMPGCPGSSADGSGCYSYSNDASLLLPATALGRSYTAMAWPSSPMQPQMNSTGFVSITATRDGTQVSLTVLGEIVPGAGLGKNGGSFVSLDAGDVLTVKAAPGEAPMGFGVSAEYGPDLSGTRIVASDPVSVIAGHRCAFVPEVSTGYCDHIEEAMLPDEVLGKEYAVTVPTSAATATWPYVLRVAAVEPDTNVHFEPSILPDTILSPGSPPLSVSGITSDVVVSADKPIVVTQVLQGSTSASVSGVAGDPDAAIAIPVEQYRNESLFLTSTTYDENYANLIAPAGASVVLDGETIPASAFSPIGASGKAVHRKKLEAKLVHSVSSDAPIGIVVYGFGDYTSYMVPGGLDLKPIYVPDPK